MGDLTGKTEIFYTEKGGRGRGGWGLKCFKNTEVRTCNI